MTLLKTIENFHIKILLPLISQCRQNPGAFDASVFAQAKDYFLKLEIMADTVKRSKDGDKIYNEKTSKIILDLLSVYKNDFDELNHFYAIFSENSPKTVLLSPNSDNIHSARSQEDAIVAIENEIKQINQAHQKRLSDHQKNKAEKPENNPFLAQKNIFSFDEQKKYRF